MRVVPCGGNQGTEPQQLSVSSCGKRWVREVSCHVQRPVRQARGAAVRRDSKVSERPDVVLAVGCVLDILFPVIIRIIGCE